MAGLLLSSAEALTCPRLELALERELEEGEEVLWQAPQLPRLEPRGFGIYLFAVPWTAFALMWTGLASFAAVKSSAEGAGWMTWAFPLFGLPFVAVGIGMLAMPWMPLFQRGRVLFAVTSRRVLQLRLGRDLTVKAVPARRIGLIERRESRDGTGVLRLAVKVGADSDGDVRTEFLDLGRIADVMGAHDAVNHLARSGSS